MALDQNTLQQAVEKLKTSQKILITPSSPADGDSIGSALALYLVLKKLGKEPTVAMSDDIPESYDFLPRTDEIQHELSSIKDFIITLDCKDAQVDTIKYQVEGEQVNIIVTPKTGKFKKESVHFKNGVENFDVIVTVDAGDIHQMRDLYEENKEMFEALPIINIDHHASNSKYGQINCVDTTSSSTTQVLIKIIDALNTTGSEIIDKDIATLLLTGLITDTGSFQHSNTTPEAFEVASRLLDLGAEQQQIIKKVYKTKSLSMLKLWGRVLSKLEYDEAHKLVWSTITTQDLLETNSTTDESNGIIDDLMSNAPGAELIILLKQKSEDLVSASVRTNSDDVNGSAFAQKFGGGGHIRAAGFRVKGKSMKDAEADVINAARAFQQARLQGKQNTADSGMIQAEQIAPEQNAHVSSEHVVEKLTRDFVQGGPHDAISKEQQAAQVAQMVSGTQTPSTPHMPVPPTPHMQQPVPQHQPAQNVQQQPEQYYPPQNQQNQPINNQPNNNFYPPQPGQGA